MLGLEQDASALQATAGLEPEVTEAALDEVLRARLLRPAATPRRFEFTHALVREAVLDELNVLRRHACTGARRTRSPGSARTATSRRSPRSCSRPRDARRAAEMLVRAGRRALDRLAYEDAAERFARALEALALADAERRGRPGAARPRRRAAARRRARRGARRLHARRASSPAAPATPRCSARPRSASPGLGVAIVGLDADAIARLEEALESAARSACCARACRRASPSSSTTPPTAPARRRSAPRPSRPRAARATAPPSPPRSTPATSRCGAPTGSRSGSRRPPT